MENNEIRIFSGSEVSVVLLKARLEEIGISSFVVNEFQSGLMAGFFGGSASSIDLFIDKANMEKAQPVIDEFNTNDKDNEPLD